MIEVSLRHFVKCLVWFCVSNHLWLSCSLCFIFLFFVIILLCCFCFLCFLGFALHNIHAFHAKLFLLILFKIYKKNKRKGRKNLFCIIFLGFEIKVGHFYLYITCLCNLFSLDELILLHLASFSFVAHVVWELLIVFDHMILILKSHDFDCKD